MKFNHSLIAFLLAFVCVNLYADSPLATPPTPNNGVTKRSAIAPPLNNAGKPVFPTVEASEHRKVSPIAMGVCPSFQISSEKMDIAGFRLGLPWIRNWNMSGIDIAIGASETTGECSGFQLSGLLNSVGSDGAGLQVAGGANLVTGDMTGFQISTFFNSARNLDGVQVSLANYTAASVAGLQIGLWDDAGDITGLQVGLGNRTTDCRGGQLGLWNSSVDVCGLQLGAINLADSAYGCQVGVINVAGTMSGLQIGVWNDARRMSGVQIGLANHIAVSPMAFLPVMNVCF